MNSQYRIIPVLAAFLLIAIPGSLAAQQSDYQIKKDYNNTYASIEQSLESALGVAEVDSLKEEIDQLEVKFEEHEELLDNALYPATFTGSIKQLRSKARTAEHRLLIIENQNERLSELTKEITSYRSEIDRLNNRADSLRKEISTSQDSEERLSGLVERYRKNIQQRDEFILDVVDSLLADYKDLSPESAKELAGKVKTGDISSGENPLPTIQTIIEENLQTLKASDQSFSTEDYLRMYTVQKRFNEAWKQIGDGLITIYGDSKKAEWETKIETKLEDWEASAAHNMWNSLDTYVEEHKLDLAAFDNNYSFFVALDNFVKNATKTSKDQLITSENYKDFKKFNEFWNKKIKNDWSKFVQEGDVLTMNQISSIDQEMVNWREEAKPKNFLIPILLAISVLIIIGLIIYLVKQRGNMQTSGTHK